VAPTFGDRPHLATILSFVPQDMGPILIGVCIKLLTPTKWLHPINIVTSRGGKVSTAPVVMPAHVGERADVFVGFY
jgi:hypothetical protein